MAQIDSLLANFYVHLHGYVFKPVDESLADVLQVVIAKYQIDSAIQTVKHPRPLCRSTQTEIAQVENYVICPYHAVPIRYHHLVHLLCILERTVAKPDDVLMIEMRI